MKKLQGLFFVVCMSNVCTAQAVLSIPAQPPAAPSALVLVIEPAVPNDGSEYSPTAIHIVLRNVSDRTVMLDKTDEEHQFVAFLLDPENRRMDLSESAKQRLLPRPNSVMVGSGGTIPLRPREESAWTWNLGRTYDLSKPGQYRLRITGTFDPASSQLSSNTIELVVVTPSH